MPLLRYFLFAGTALLVLLFAADACLPKLPVVASAATAANAVTDLSVIRIRSDRKWPERIEFDTRQPTIAPVLVRTAATDVPARVADAAAPAHARDAFAQLQPPEPKKLESRLPPRRRTVASRAGAKRHAAPPTILVAQQPHLGFFTNTIW